MKRIYVASSWRNAHQPNVVLYLLGLGHEVYDFRNPPGRSGFAWSEISEGWRNWSPEEYRDALKHPLAQAGYKSDMDALKGAEICVLVLPNGRSASFEAGVVFGMGKPVIVYMPEPCEPELMYRECQIVTRMTELGQAVQEQDDGRFRRYF